MKTYGRKKLGDNVEVEEIVDLDEVCRLCMEKEDELISIFNNEETVPLTLRIMACVALEVSLEFKIIVLLRLTLDVALTILNLFNCNKWLKYSFLLCIY